MVTLYNLRERHDCAQPHMYVHAHVGLRAQGVHKDCPHSVIKMHQVAEKFSREGEDGYIERMLLSAQWKCLAACVSHPDALKVGSHGEQISAQI